MKFRFTLEYTVPKYLRLIFSKASDEDITNHGLCVFGEEFNTMGFSVTHVEIIRDKELPELKSSKY